MSVYNGKPCGFLLFENWHNKPDTASSRIRGHWLIENWDGAEVFQQGAKYETVIFQKVYWPEYAEVFDGIKILDIVDPDWMDEMPVKAMVDACDAVVVSTEELKSTIQQFTDKLVVFIPDRQKLEFHNKQKVHKGRAETVCWYGYSHNTVALDRAIGLIKKNKLKLTVISNMRPPYPRSDENVKWQLETINDEILKHDFVVMPTDLRPRGKYKSNNKITKAWALGMPVAIEPEDLERFLDPVERTKEAQLRLKEVKEKFDIKLSVLEMKQLIEKIKQSKK